MTQQVLDEQFENAPQWFDGKDVESFLFRINRRHLNGDQPMLFARVHEDALSHAYEVLKRAQSTRYGRNGGWEWRIGNLFMSTDGWLTGRLGGMRTVPSVRQVFNDETNEWDDITGEDVLTVVTPFALIGESRILSVAAHPEISAKTVSGVLGELMNQGEFTLSTPTTDWGIDPILNELEFIDWIDRTPHVTKVKFVFARPNPDGADDLQDMMDRLDRLRAASITEEIKAVDPDEGLDKSELKDDPFFRKLVSAARRSWAIVTATGTDNNQTMKYRQKKSVASERIAVPVHTWDALTAEVVEAGERGGRHIA